MAELTGTNEHYDRPGMPDPLMAEIELEEASESPEERLEGLVQRAAEEALLWRDEELDDVQAKATDYYMGRPFGNEEEGRSRVVSTDVRDTVQAIMPSLMRIFFSPENTVEYEPQGPEDVQAAEQATDMANYVVRNDNNGFLTIHGAFKDAMVRKLGIIKYWWEEMTVMEGYPYSGLSEAQVFALNQEEGVEVEVLGQSMGPEGVMLYEANVLRERKDGRVKIAAVPPEEFIFSPEARDQDHAEMIGHVRPVPASDLVAMGIPKDLVDEHKGKIRYTQTGDDLAAERRFDQDQREQLRDEKDGSRDECWFGEIYVYCDMSEEQDGIAQLVKARVIGEDHELVDWEPCDERPFALFVCDPEPHTLVALSVADNVMDVQLIKSAIMRGQLDSLTLTLNPRTEAVEGEVNMSDLLNPEIGGVVRVTRPGMLREVAHSFVGKEAFPMLQYMDEQKENRTGISKAAAGLDADALQSATKAAVAATLSGAQQHIEMLARVFAETGMKRLYKGILKLLVQHQDQARTVRLRNEWTEVDPASWNADMDVTVNVALGAGSSEEKLQLLQLISQNQEAQLQQGSPLVSLVEYRKTLGRMVELAGFANSDEFYKPWTEQQNQQYEQQKSQQQPQDPAMMLAQAQIQIEQQKLQLEQQEAIWKDQRERAKIEMDFAIKQATAEAQYGAQISNQELQADMATAKAVIDAAAKEAVARQTGGPNVAQPNSAGGGSPTPA